MIIGRPFLLADKRDYRELGNLAGRLEDYEQLLEGLSLRVGDEDRTLIRKTLDRVEWPRLYVKRSG